MPDTPDQDFTKFDKAVKSGDNLGAASALRDFIRDDMKSGKTLDEAERDFRQRLKSDQSIQNLLPSLSIDFENSDHNTHFSAHIRERQGSGDQTQFDDIYTSGNVKDNSTDSGSYTRKKKGTPTSSAGEEPNTRVAPATEIF